MLSDTKIEHKIITAALKLAEKGDWRNVSLADIAGEAGVGVVELREHYAGKGAILAAYVKAVDAATLEKFGRYDAEERVRDRLFDVLMTRFDVMAPHKKALKEIAATPQFMPELIMPALSSVRWMMEAAGMATDRPIGTLQVPGVAAVLQSAFMTWLKDEDAGQAKTMAKLDKGLRRAERWTRTVEDGGAAVWRVVDALRSDSGRWWKGRRGSGRSKMTEDEDVGDADSRSASDGPAPSIH